jgi:hypothetical protein
VGADASCGISTSSRAADISSASVPEPIRVQDPAPGRGHALRNVSLGCVGLIALLIIIGVVANGANSTKRPTPQIDLSGRSSSRATVGGEDAVSFTA